MLTALTLPIRSQDLPHSPLMNKIRLCVGWAGAGRIGAGRLVRLQSSVLPSTFRTPRNKKPRTESAMMGEQERANLPEAGCSYCFFLVFDQGDHRLHYVRYMMSTAWLTLNLPKYTIFAAVLTHHNYVNKAWSGIILCSEGQLRFEKFQLVYVISDAIRSFITLCFLTRRPSFFWLRMATVCR